MIFSYYTLQYKTNCKILLTQYNLNDLIQSTWICNKKEGYYIISVAVSIVLRIIPPLQQLETHMSLQQLANDNDPIYSQSTKSCKSCHFSCSSVFFLFVLLFHSWHNSWKTDNCNLFHAKFKCYLSNMRKGETY